MKPREITIVIRAAVIILGLALIGISMYQMPPWFRNWFVGMCMVVGTWFLIIHDNSDKENKPRNPETSSSSCSRSNV